MIFIQNIYKWHVNLAVIVAATARLPAFDIVINRWGRLISVCEKPI